MENPNLENESIHSSAESEAENDFQGSDRVDDINGLRHSLNNNSDEDDENNEEVEVSDEDTDMESDEDTDSASDDDEDKMLDSLQDREELDEIPTGKSEDEIHYMPYNYHDQAKNIMETIKRQCIENISEDVYKYSLGTYDHGSAWPYELSQERGAPLPNEEDIKKDDLRKAHQMLNFKIPGLDMAGKLPEYDEDSLTLFANKENLEHVSLRGVVDIDNPIMIGHGGGTEFTSTSGNPHEWPFKVNAKGIPPFDYERYLVKSRVSDEDKIAFEHMRMLLIFEINAIFERTVRKQVSEENKDASFAFTPENERKVLRSDLDIRMPQQSLAKVLNVVDRILVGFIESDTHFNTLTGRHIHDWTCVVQDDAMVGRTLDRCAHLYLSPTFNTSKRIYKPPTAKIDVLNRINRLFTTLPKDAPHVPEMRTLEPDPIIAHSKDYYRSDEYRNFDSTKEESNHLYYHILPDSTASKVPLINYRPDFDIGLSEETDSPHSRNIQHQYLKGQKYSIPVESSKYDGNWMIEEYTMPFEYVQPRTLPMRSWQAAADHSRARTQVLSQVQNILRTRKSHRKVLKRLDKYSHGSCETIYRRYKHKLRKRLKKITQRELSKKGISQSEIDSRIAENLIELENNLESDSEVYTGPNIRPEYIAGCESPSDAVETYTKGLNVDVFKKLAYSGQYISKKPSQVYKDIYGSK